MICASRPLLCDLCTPIFDTDYVLSQVFSLKFVKNSWLDFESLLMYIYENSTEFDIVKDLLQGPHSLNVVERSYIIGPIILVKVNV